MTVAAEAVQIMGTFRTSMGLIVSSLHTLVWAADVQPNTTLEKARIRLVERRIRVFVKKIREEE